MRSKPSASVVEITFCCIAAEIDGTVGRAAPLQWAGLEPCHPSVTGAPESLRRGGPEALTDRAANTSAASALLAVGTQGFRMLADAYIRGRLRAAGHARGKPWPAPLG